jgi:hypothetical protein
VHQPFSVGHFVTFVVLLDYLLVLVQGRTGDSKYCSHNSMLSLPVTSGFSGLVVSMLVSRSRLQTRLKPSDFSGEEILSMPSFGGEVKQSVPYRRFAACKRSRHLPWKSHAVGKIGSAISRPSFLPSLIEVFHVAGRGAPLEMTGETKSGAQRARL